VFNAISATTVVTAVFIFHFVVMLYTMFYFLTDGPALLRAILGYLPLAEDDTEQLLGQFVSVTRATLKGTILIGVAQGALGAMAFRAVGIDGAIFWGAVMTVLSIIPGIGAPLVWVPAALILFAIGQVWQPVALILFCGFVVGSVDNLLRPALVGHDTKMHELLIFFSTLGGLSLFGVTGFILGPLLAGLFLTAWEMFGVAFRQEINQSSASIGPDLQSPDQGA
jgi:predicted PurR-regulated permease PerM